MSTSVAGIHAPTSSVSVVTNAQISARFPEIEHTEDEAGRIALALENPGNDQLVIIDGTLDELRVFAQAIQLTVHAHAADKHGNVGRAA